MVSLDIDDIAELCEVLEPVIVSPFVNPVVGTIIVSLLLLSFLLSIVAVTPLEAPVIVSPTEKLDAEATVTSIVLSAKLVGL